MAMTMNNEHRRGLLTPLLFVLPALGILIGLGTWQLERLEWKRGLIAEIGDRLTADPVALPADIEAPGLWRYRRVRVSGHFLNDQERHVYAIGAGGAAGETAQPGYHIYTPLARPDGAWLLVNRGWVPDRLKDPAERPEGQLEGEVTLTGVVRLSRSRGPFAATDRPEKNIWFAPDLALLAKDLGHDLMPVIVEAGPAPNPGGWPRGGVTRVDIPNDHLQYALTWYGLALTLLAVFAVYAGKARRERRG